MRIAQALGTRAIGTPQYANADTIDAAVALTAETAFATTVTIPAGMIATGKALRIFAGFQTTATAGPTTTLKLKLGGVVVWSSSTLTPVETNAGHGLLFSIVGTVAAAVSAAVDASFVAAYWGGSAFNMNSTAQPINLATNGDLIVSLTAQYSASTAGNTISLRQLVAEALN